ncbi:hypothetical protein [Nocardia amamiensis]|uniref:hypothetical protein n=1 Tax=Nocardia amamiensis TaxID=404578 RepID=UPI00082FC3DF|nr:hypothetical protein [Nocardia amamiensis]
MKATRLVRLGLPPFFAAAAALLFCPPTVSAQEVWSYTCSSHSPVWEGRVTAMECTASNGAPESGEITQPFLVNGVEVMSCSSGWAHLPDLMGKECAAAPMQ